MTDPIGLMITESIYGEGAFTVGVDLGQAADHSALVVVEHVLRWPPNLTRGRYGGRRDLIWEFHVRAVKRWPLGTTYVNVVDDCCRVMQTDPLSDSGRLFYDGTGVGRAVGELFDQSFSRSEIPVHLPAPVTFTQQSKANMVSTLLVAIERGRLRIADSVLLGAVLESELRGFRQKINPGGSTSYDIPRTGEGHGDIATATALMVALCHGEWVPGVRQTLRCIDFPTGYMVPTDGHLVQMRRRGW